MIQQLLLIMSFVWLAGASVSLAVDLTDLHSRWQRHEITDIDFLAGLKSYWRRSPHPAARSKLVGLVARNEPLMNLILAQLGSEDFQPQAADILFRVIHHERRPDLMDRILAMVPGASPRVVKGIAQALETGHHLPPRVKTAFVGLLAHENLEVQVQAGQVLAGHLTEIGPGERRRIYEMWSGAHEADTNRPTVDLEYNAFTNNNGVANQFLDFLRDRSTSTVSGWPASEPGSAADAVATFLGVSARSHSVVAEHILDLLADGTTPLPFQKTLLNILGRGTNRFTLSSMTRLQDQILKLMAHRDPEMRVEAIRALANCDLLKGNYVDWRANQAAVIARLDDGDIRVREAAVRQLLEHVDEATRGALLHVLKNGNLSPHVRVEILKSPFIYAINQDQNPFEQLVRDVSPEVRVATIEVLARSRFPALLPHLRSEENQSVRLALLNALEKWMKRPDLLNHIENYFSDGNPQVRAHAIKVAYVHTENAPRRMQPLIRALSDPNREVRLAAVAAARYMLDTTWYRLPPEMKRELDQAFISVLEDSDPEMRRVGLAYFTDYAPHSEEFLLATLRRMRDIDGNVSSEAIATAVRHAVYNPELRHALVRLQGELNHPMDLVQNIEADIVNGLQYAGSPTPANRKYGLQRLQRHLPFHREVHAAFTRALEDGSLEITDDVFLSLLRDSPLRTESTILETLRTVGRNSQILWVLNKLEEFSDLSEETLLEVSRYLDVTTPQSRAKNRTAPEGMELLEIRHAAARVLGAQEDRVVTPTTLQAISDRIAKLSREFDARMVEPPTVTETPLRGMYRGEVPTIEQANVANLTAETRKLRAKAQELRRELRAIPLFSGKRVSLKARIKDRVSRLVARWRTPPSAVIPHTEISTETVDKMVAAFRAHSRYVNVGHSSDTSVTDITKVRVVNEDAVPLADLAEHEGELELEECTKGSLRTMVREK